VARAASWPRRAAASSTATSTHLADFTGCRQAIRHYPGRRWDGQTQQGQGQGQGTNNSSVVPYTNVYQDFFDFALTSLDRSYVPLDVKDFVRDYFSSLNPTSSQ
jgi:hypothetical protein